MTRLCVPIPVRSPEQARADAFKAVERGADVIELRLDALPDEVLEDADGHEAAEILALIRRLQESNVKTILTLRPTAEGGTSDLDDEHRFDRLAQLAVREPTWVDLEWRPMNRAGGWPMAFLDLAAGGQVRAIASAHDFDGRPGDLLTVFAEMSGSRADFAKLAWRARSVRDCVEAFELLREAAKPSVAICMGEEGLPTRVLAKKFGAFITFASLNDSAATADGQVPIDVMKRRYRWDALKRTTLVYGVVGHPVAHSKSPHVHNANFDAVDHDGIYLPLPVQPSYEAFKAFMETWLPFEPLHLSGLSVTLPHKEHALRYVREVGGTVDPLAERVGAVNTITIRRDDGTPRLAAYNTDLDAMVRTAADALGKTPGDLRGAGVGVLGAGGTGRTATAAFRQLGCDVTIYNRTRGKADDLAAQFDAGAADLGSVAKARHDVWINTTSVGMHPRVDESPIGESLPPLDDRTLVFDTIYNPRETTLLRLARRAGARAVNGQPMFLHQALAQARLWTDAEPDAEAMERAFAES